VNQTVYMASALQLLWHVPTTWGPSAFSLWFLYNRGPLSDISCLIDIMINVWAHDGYTSI